MRADIMRELDQRLATLVSAINMAAAAAAATPVQPRPPPSMPLPYLEALLGWPHNSSYPGQANVHRVAKRVGSRPLPTPPPPPTPHLHPPPPTPPHPTPTHTPIRKPGKHQPVSDGGTVAPFHPGSSPAQGPILGSTHLRPPWCWTQYWLLHSIPPGSQSPKKT